MSPGAHTLEMGVQSNGVVDYMLDGKLAYSTSALDPPSFIGIDLPGGNGPITYTNFQLGDDFSGPPATPEPGTLLLVGMGLPGVLFWRKRRRVG
jgi:hypothetical protein